MCAAINFPFAPPTSLKREFEIKKTVHMSPGPGDCSDRVLKATGCHVMGSFNPQLLTVLDEIKDGLRYVFQTNNTLTLAVTGTGHAGMETALSNLIEPGDTVLVLLNGFWTPRACEMAERYGANVKSIQRAPNESTPLADLEEAIIREKPSIMYIVHGESSCGVLQSIEGLGKICHDHNCLLVVDAVASLGGVVFLTDEWEVDCAFAASQKALGAPAGLAPITFSPRALQKIEKRKTKSPVFYFDIKLMGQYWNCFEDKPRMYHHTPAGHLLCGLREALAMVVEEGLENRIERHNRLSKQLYKGLDDLGLAYYVKDPKARLPSVVSIILPEGKDAVRVFEIAMNQYKCEIGFGLGPSRGKVIRIGIMGDSATPEKIQETLKMLKDILIDNVVV